MGAAVVPDCIPGVDPICVPSMLIANGARRILDEIAGQSSEAAAQMLKTLVAGWLKVDTPEISQASGVVAELRKYTHWLVAAVAVGALLVGAIRLAIERNGREAGSVARGLAALVVVTGAGVPAVQVLIQIGDSYSNWILDIAADGDLGARLLMLAPAAATATFSPIIVIGISLVMFMATMVQLLMLLARNAGLVLLAGLLPLAAAAGISGSGQAVRNRYLTWLLALVLYKPAAATIYAAVFWLGKGQTLTDVLTGAVMFCMAIVALPALLRLIAPAVSVLSSGGSGGVGAAAVSAAGQAASGAVRLIGSSGGSSGKGSSGGQGRPGGADPSTPVPRPSGGGTGPGAAVPGGAAGAGTTGAGAGAGAGTAGAGAGASGGAAGAGAGAAGAGAAAAGPVGVAAAAAVTAAKAGPAAVRKVGGTASGAVDGGGS